MSSQKKKEKEIYDKEILNVKYLIYDEILKKDEIKADCIGLIKEEVDKELIKLKHYFLKKWMKIEYYL